MFIETAKAKFSWTRVCKDFDTIILSFNDCQA